MRESVLSFIMETYSHPVSAEFDKAMASAKRLPIAECIDLAAQCGVIYNAALASTLTHYDILEVVWSEGDFALFCDLITSRVSGG